MTNLGVKSIKGIDFFPQFFYLPLPHVKQLFASTGWQISCKFSAFSPPNFQPHLLIKVGKFQNGFMKSSFTPKSERKIVRISALCKGQIKSEWICWNHQVSKKDPKNLKDFCPMYYKISQGRNPSNFSIIFWKMMIS